MTTKKRVAVELKEEMWIGLNKKYPGTYLTPTQKVKLALTEIRLKDARK